MIIRLICRLLWDGIVLTIDIGIECKSEGCFGHFDEQVPSWFFQQVGHLLLSDPPILLDFNEQGVQEAFCEDCGGGFKKELMEFKRTIQSTFVNALSNNKFKKLIKVIHINKRLRHLKYREMENEIQTIRSTCSTKKDLIDYLSQIYHENPDFIEEKLSLF